MLLFSNLSWRFTCLIFLIGLFSLNACSEQEASEPLQIEVIQTDTPALLQAFDKGEDGKLWVSGHQSTYGWAKKPYTNWQFEQVQGLDTLLQFRDIVVTENAVFLMSAGNGTMSRIYRSDLHSMEWKEVYRGDKDSIFLDSIDFFNEQHGIAYGDSFDGDLFILQTQDGGLSWKTISPDLLPDALEGEGGFASSGTCIEIVDEQSALIATGNAETSRLLVTRDQGASWKAINLALVSGEAAGATGVQIDEQKVAWIYGGDLNSAITGGTRLQRYDFKNDSLFAPSMVSFEGAIYGLDVHTNEFSSTKQVDWVVAANPNGLYVNALPANQEMIPPMWLQVDTSSYWAVVSVEKHIFAAGPKGRISKLSLKSLKKLVFLPND